MSVQAGKQADRQRRAGQAAQWIHWWDAPGGEELGGLSASCRQQLGVGRQAVGLGSWRLRACLRACVLACACHHVLQVSLAQPVALPPQQVSNHGPPPVGIRQGDVHSLGQPAPHLIGTNRSRRTHTHRSRQAGGGGRRIGQEASRAGTQAGRCDLPRGHILHAGCQLGSASSAAPAQQHQLTASSSSQGRFVAPSTTTRSLPLATPSNCPWQGGAGQMGAGGAAAMSSENNCGWRC